VSNLVDYVSGDPQARSHRHGTDEDQLNEDLDSRDWTSAAQHSAERPRVVVTGGGFGGVFAARRLRCAKVKPSVEDAAWAITS